jgi:predicted RNA binding protein YcfA (HicA-like mRNA interferase family)
MKSLTGRELTRILEKHSRQLLRIHDSHHIYVKPKSNVRLSILVHGNKALKTGLLQHLLKMAGIPEAT